MSLASFRLVNPVQIEAIVPEGAIEAFTESVLHRLAGLNETQFDAGLPGPDKHGLASQFGAVVEHDLPWQTKPPGKVVEVF